MKTIRHNVFETNSSSCHVMTIMSAEEKELVDNRQAIVYAHSKSDGMPNIAEIFDFTKFSNKMKEIFKDNYNDKI